MSETLKQDINKPERPSADTRGAVLIGFMGVGKSTAGPMVAEAMGIEFYDTDLWMRDEMGIDVPKLVSSNMEEFRRREVQAFQQITKQEPGIISTGGGFISTKEGRQALIESPLSVGWMQVPFNDLVIRVQQDEVGDRPLFEDVEFARSLYEERDPWYAQTAAFEVDATVPALEVASNITLSLGIINLS